MKFLSCFVCLIGGMLASVAALPLDAEITPMIVGGSPVNIVDYPFQVSVQYLARHQCGGSIIAPKYVLTAAHCVVDGSAAQYRVRAGSKNSTGGGVLRVAAALHKHASYDNDTADNDIAIIELASKLTYTTLVQPVPLAIAGTEPTAGASATVSGWGATYEGGGSVEMLRAVTYQIVSRANCKSIYSSSGMTITNAMICAQAAVGGKDACQGDSGGPLTINGTQVGVVSWGIGCARVAFPGVYAHVANLRYFIDGIVPGL